MKKLVLFLTVSLSFLVGSCKKQDVPDVMSANQPQVQVSVLESKKIIEKRLGAEYVRLAKIYESAFVFTGEYVKKHKVNASRQEDLAKLTKEVTESFYKQLDQETVDFLHKIEERNNQSARKGTRATLDVSTNCNCPSTPQPRFFGADGIIRDLNAYPIPDKQDHFIRPIGIGSLQNSTTDQMYNTLASVSTLINNSVNPSTPTSYELYPGTQDYDNVSNYLAYSYASLNYITTYDLTPIDTTWTPGMRWKWWKCLFGSLGSAGLGGLAGAGLGPGGIFAGIISGALTGIATYC